MSKERETVQVFVIPSCHCQRCGHDWTIRKPIRPTICPACKSAYWDRPKRGH